MPSEFSNLLHVAAAFASDYVRVAFYGLAARWPHCKVGNTPAARSADLDLMSKWMRIPRPMSNGVPAPDPVFLEILKKPFSYHRTAGTEDGLLVAVRALGYSDVRYLDFNELLDPPMGSVVPGGPIVVNQNAFGMTSSTFPSLWSGLSSPPALGSDMDILLRTIKMNKRASARIWELRIVDTLVVSQDWWEGPQNPANVEIVVSQEWWEGGQDPNFVEIVVA